jgi:hypothetical protein
LRDSPLGEAIRRKASLSLNNGERRKLSKIGAVKVFQPRAIFADLTNKENARDVLEPTQLGGMVACVRPERPAITGGTDAASRARGR